MDDLISRQAAIDALKAMAVPLYKDPACEDIWERDRTLDNAIDAIRGLQSAQPEPITVNIDHEFTQEEYVKLFKDMTSAPTVLLPSAQPEIIRCKDCRWNIGDVCCFEEYAAADFDENGFCSFAEERG